MSDGLLSCEVFQETIEKMDQYINFKNNKINLQDIMDIDFKVLGISIPTIPIIPLNIATKIIHYLRACRLFLANKLFYIWSIKSKKSSF